MDSKSHMDESGADRAVVLIVDDEPAILALLPKLLAHPAFEILTAASAAAALELMRAQPIDLVLADYLMPAMDGLELMQRIRQEWPGTRRMMMTASPDLDRLHQAIAQGLIAAFVPKPEGLLTLKARLLASLFGQQEVQSTRAGSVNLPL